MTTPSVRKTLSFATLALVVCSSAFAEKSPAKIADPVEVMGAVEIIGEPYKQPFMIFEHLQISAAGYSKSKLIDLPAGKRIVIETVSVSARASTGSTVQGRFYFTKPDVGTVGELVTIFVEQGIVPNVGSTVLHTATSTSPIRFNSDDLSLYYTIHRAGSGSANCFVTIFGYIEEL